MAENGYVPEDAIVPEERRVDTQVDDKNANGSYYSGCYYWPQNNRTPQHQIRTQDNSTCCIDLWCDGICDSVDFDPLCLCVCDGCAHAGNLAGECIGCVCVSLLSGCEDD